MQFVLGIFKDKERTTNPSFRGLVEAFKSHRMRRVKKATMDSNLAATAVKETIK